jgi:hypothetical protein
MTFTPRLTDVQLAELRAARAGGEVTHAELARRFGISVDLSIRLCRGVCPRGKAPPAGSPAERIMALAGQRAGAPGAAWLARGKGRPRPEAQLARQVAALVMADIGWTPAQIGDAFDGAWSYQVREILWRARHNDQALRLAAAIRPSVAGVEPQRAA